MSAYRDARHSNHKAKDNTANGREQLVLDYDEQRLQAHLQPIGGSVYVGASGVRGGEPLTGILILENGVYECFGPDRIHAWFPDPSVTPVTLVVVEHLAAPGGSPYPR